MNVFVNTGSQNELPPKSGWAQIKGQGEECGHLGGGESKITALLFQKEPSEVICVSGEVFQTCLIGSEALELTQDSLERRHPLVGQEFAEERYVCGSL